MKICVLTHSFPRNSQDVAAAFMKEFCDGLIENGNEVILLTPYDPVFKREGDKFKIFTYRYIWPSYFHQIGYSRSMEADISLKPFNYLLAPFLIFFGTVSLYRVVKKEKVELISVHWILPNGIMALIVSILTGIPYTVTLPGTDAYLASKNKFFGLLAKLVAQRSSALFSNSRWHLEKILRLGVKVPINEVITYPVDIKKFIPLKNGFENLRGKYNLTKNTFVVLAVGRLVYKKGFEYLIEALPEVIKKYPNLKVIIGGEGDLYSDLVALAKKLRIEKQVFFPGNLRRDEIIYYYNLADVVVTPSIIDEGGNIDGRPLVILESMACGKPQIVTNLPGISDALQNGVNALLVPQKDSKAISKALFQIITSKALRDKMSGENRKLAEDKLSTKRIGELYTYFFKKIKRNA